MNLISLSDLDHEIHVTLVLITGDRRVRTNHWLSVQLHDQVDVLANRQPKDVLRRGQSEAEPARVVTNLLLF